MDDFMISAPSSWMGLIGLCFLGTSVCRGAHSACPRVSTAMCLIDSHGGRLFKASAFPSYQELCIAYFSIILLVSSILADKLFAQ